MSVSLHEKRKTYIDAKAAEILNLIIVQPFKEKEMERSEVPHGYLAQKEFINLGEVRGPVHMSRMEGTRYFERYRLLENQRIGYDKNGFTEIYKLIDNVLKEPSVKNVISEEFLAEIIYDWLIDNYKSDIQNLSLSEKIEQECNKSIIEFFIYFPVLFLEANKEFTLGNVKFLYFKEDYIKELSLKLEEHKRKQFIEWLLHYKGQLMACYSISAEKTKAIELASHQITLSIDVLRITSPTVEVPDFKLFYDVDFRNAHQLQSKVIIQVATEEEHLSAQFFRKAIPFVIDDTVWGIMLQQELKVIHDFIIRTSTTKSELEGLIYNAIKNFSKAIATHDLHERVVQVFTVLESLLLPDEGSAIIDSVCKYLPKLITRDIEERRLTIDTLKEMYKIRSKMVHHAKKGDFPLENLAIIQICTRALILQLIKLSLTKKTKMEILKEIDDLINRA